MDPKSGWRSEHADDCASAVSDVVVSSVCVFTTQRERHTRARSLSHFATSDMDSFT